LAEFLIVAPLELVSWGFQRFLAILQKKLDLGRKRGVRIVFTIICLCCLSVISIFIHLGVNLVTGIIRRFVAPVRYLIRPAIETGVKYPKSFAAIVAVTLSVAIFLTITILTGGLPIITSSLFPASTLAIKLITIGMMSASLGAFLTKAFNTTRELISKMKESVPSCSTQMSAVNKRNQKTNYSITILKPDQEVTKDLLDQKHQDDVPLLIWQKIGDETQFLMYGRSPEGGTKLHELSGRGYFFDLFKGIEINQMAIKKPASICWKVYRDINNENAHTPQKVGSTAKITEALHAINIDDVEVRAREDQDFYYTAALFIGAEYFFYPRKKSSCSSTNVKSELGSKIDLI
jgi:hypothetical protein